MRRNTSLGNDFFYFKCRMNFTPPCGEFSVVRWDPNHRRKKGPLGWQPAEKKPHWCVAGVRTGRATPRSAGFVLFFFAQVSDACGAFGNADIRRTLWSRLPSCKCGEHQVSATSNRFFHWQKTITQAWCVGLDREQVRPNDNSESQ